MGDQHYEDIAHEALESARNRPQQARAAITLAMATMTSAQLDALSSATLAIARGRDPAERPAKRARTQLRVMNRIAIVSSALVSLEDERVRGKVHDAEALDALATARDYCAHVLADYARALIAV